MGDRQSMVVLKKGDWISVEDRVYQVSDVLNDHIFVRGEWWGFYLPYQVTKIDPSLYPILSDSISNGETND